MVMALRWHKPCEFGLVYGTFADNRWSVRSGQWGGDYHQTKRRLVRNRDGLTGTRWTGKWELELALFGEQRR
jgi:hypothetical protein